MNKSLTHKALYGLAALVGITAASAAQEAELSIAVCPAGARCADQQASITVMDNPAMVKAQIGVITSDGMGFGFQEKAEAVKNQPYQAQAVTTVKQTLADGSHILQTTTATVARDSEGRTVRIQKMAAIGPWKSASGSSEANGPTLTTIFDPVAKNHIDYTSDNKVAHVLPMPALAPGGVSGEAHGFAFFSSGPGPGGPGPTTLSLQTRGDAPQPLLAGEGKTEPLGVKSIEGLSVTGTKTTDTIPAGTIGNDKDLLITRETWYSSDLKLVVQSTQIDPRFGETTYSLANIQRNEPDPSLFQVPAGYTIEKPHVIVRDR
jgi:hypothetical protein